MILDFNCKYCSKRRVCKYKDSQIPNIVSKIEAKEDSLYTLSILELKLLCKEFQRDLLTLS